MNLFARMNRYSSECLYYYYHVMRSIDFIWYLPYKVYPTTDLFFSFPLQSNKELVSFQHRIKSLEIATLGLAFFYFLCVYNLGFSKQSKKGKICTWILLNSPWHQFETQVKLPACVWLTNSVFGDGGIHNVIFMPFTFKISSFEHCKVHLSFWN